jgi:hypothetical protein
MSPLVMSCTTTHNSAGLVQSTGRVDFCTGRACGYALENPLTAKCDPPHMHAARVVGQV